MNILGIDPGTRGAVALLSNNNLVGAWDLRPVKVGRRTFVSFPPEAERLICKVHAVVMEEPTIHPKFGKVALYTFGAAVGACYAHYRQMYGQSRFILVEPKKWQREYGGGKRTWDKGSSLHVARDLFPGFDTKNHNRSDAILIAEYGRRLLGGSEG